MRFRYIAVLLVILASTVAFTSNRAPGRTRPHTGQVNQCKLPLSERKGGWLCMNAGASRLPDVKGKCHFIRPFGKGAAWCYREAGLSEFMSTGFIGYGKGVLGSVTVSFTVTLRLKESHSLPVAFRTTARHVIDLEMQGNRLYYSSACAAGCPVQPNVYAQHKFSGGILRDRTVDWPHGYKATEPAVHDGAVFHQWVFHVSGYPGHWFIFAKSIHYKFVPFKNGQLSDRAEFYKPGIWQKRLGVNPAGGGWTQ